jgi:hypothetical protein
VLFLFSVIGGAAGTGVMSLAAAELQKQVTEQKKTLDTAAAEEKALRAEFQARDFGALHDKATQASVKQTQAMNAMIAAPDDSPADKKAYDAWQVAIRECFSVVAEYNEAARAYPPGWFGASAPAFVSVGDGTNAIECFSW